MEYADKFICSQCILIVMTYKRKIAETLAKFFLRSGRGQGLTNRIIDPIKDILQGTVYLFAIKELFGITINPEYLVFIVIAKSIIEYLLGWFDQRVGFWKIENEYATHELNPFNKELMERIKRIEHKMGD